MRQVAMALVAGAALAAMAGMPKLTTGGYRGPNGDGVYPATGLLKAWPAEGPKLLWKANVGEGYAGVAVEDGIVYASGGNNGQLIGYTLDGEEKFRYGYGGCGWKRFSGTRSTPLLTEEVVVVSRPDAQIIGLDLKSGEERWSLNAWKSFGAGIGDMGWGYPSTPSRYGDTIILNPVSRVDETPPIVAVDMNTGKTAWKADAGTGKRYSCSDTSASVFTHNGLAMSVNPTWRYILALGAEDGRHLWEIPDPDPIKGGDKVMTPVYGEGGYLLFDRSKRATQVKLSEDGLSYTPLWARPFPGSSYGHAVTMHGRTYLKGDAADYLWRGEEAIALPSVAKLAGPRVPKGAPKPPGMPGGLLCVDADTGKVIDWLRTEGVGHIIAADGMIYVINMPSAPEKERSVVDREPKLGLTVYLIEPVADGMRLRGRYHLPMTIEDAKQVRELEFQANICPVIAEGRLFIRYGPLWVYDLRAGSVEEPAAPPAATGTDGLWDFVVEGVCPGGGADLTVALRVLDGKLEAGAAVAQGWNFATHLVDGSDLKVAENGLAGVLRIALQPDATKPVDRKPIALEVKLHVTRDAEGRLRGEYSGVEGATSATVRGRFAG